MEITKTDFHANRDGQKMTMKMYVDQFYFTLIRIT